MKKTILSTALAAILLLGYSCKGKDKQTNESTNNTTTTTTAPTTTAPVEVTGDDALRKGVEDATKDISGLQTRVENGVIYLSGTISQEDNRRITPTLNSLRPQSINRDNLTVK